MNESKLQDSIAIIGMAGRFPGAKNVNEFWKNIRDGVESITFFGDEELKNSGVAPALLQDSDYVKAYGALEDVEMFDASFFNFSPKEAAMMDPQHRLFLQCAWEALENAGYDSAKYDGRIGVYAGAGISTYLIRNLASNPKLFNTFSNFDIATTNDKDAIPMRVSYKLNLKGPSINVATTCSTSLVAIHLGCQSLLNDQSDMVLAGGIFVRVPQREGYWYQEGMMFSPDGHSRAFDAQAAGLVPASGAGIVVLKSLKKALADGDCIYATIKGSAVTNDGSAKMSYATSSVDGQAETVIQALSSAGVGAETISYIEAQGTGTKLGDPIEIKALTKAFRATLPKTDYLCPIGSLKPNIGHTNNAAGVIGLMKVVLAMKHRLLPPTLHFQKPNPKIDFANSPFYVNATLQEWKTDGIPRRAGISAFGVGGTNAHAILEEAPIQEPSGKSRPWQLLVLSAKTESALETATTQLAKYFQAHQELNFADAAYTLQLGRKDFNHRRILVCHSIDEAANLLEKREPKRIFTSVSKRRSVVFMFSEQESQYVNMGLELYQIEPTFQKQVDICSEILKPIIGFDLRHLLYPNKEATQQLQQTAINQVAIFVIDYALAQLWMEWGVRPKAMVGHSIGEYVAACLAGVFSLEEALSLVAAQGQMIQQQIPPGAMLATPFTAKELEAYLGKELSLAVTNRPSLSVAAGNIEAIEALQKQLTDEGVECRRLSASHALHSEMMDPIVEQFAERVRKINLKPPQIPYLSNVTGNWITAAEATDPNYWAKHLRHTVRFNECLQQLLLEPTQILLEVGPGRTLGALINQHPDKAPEQFIVSSVRESKDNQSDVAFLLTTLGKLWAAGVKINWSGFYALEQRHRVPLPTYPFELHRYWIDPQKQSAVGGTSQLAGNEESEDQEAEDSFSLFSSRPNLSSYTAPRDKKEQKLAKIWQSFLGVEQVGIHDNFFDLGGCSLIASHLITKVRKTMQAELSVQKFLNAPTIAELAELIDTADSTQDVKPALPSSLVKIQAGNKKPLFLVHPIYGQVFLYRELAQSLNPDQPVYGFQALGFDGETEPLNKIEDMAAHYIKAMRTLQPVGPYLLGGSSFGGLVAFEMAQQLHALDQKVALLFLADTPAVDQALFNLEDDAAILLFIADHMLKLNINSLSLNDLRKLAFEEQISCILELTEERKGFEASQIQQLVQVIRANHEARKNYSPRIYPEKFIFFRAEEPLEKDTIYHPEHFWLEFAGGGIEINTVPGNHFTMNYQPHVQAIAEKIKF